MIDSHYRSIYQKLLIEPLLKLKQINKLSPTTVTLFACFFGVLSGVLVGLSYSTIGIVTFLFSGFLDTLDGSIARSSNTTSPKGALLDIFSDRIVEVSISLGLLFRAIDHAPYIAILIASILLCITSFLTVGIFESNTSHKSFHYSVGIIERSEAFIFFILMILFPGILPYTALLFSILMVYTAFKRVWDFLVKN